MLGQVEPVTGSARLVDTESCRRIIAAANARMVPCSREEAAQLVAELIAAYPDLSMAKADPSLDFKAYTVKMLEAFVQFSYDIGKAIVHGGTGVPALTPFKPKPADIAAFGKKELEATQNVKIMALRHLQECDRREKEQQAREDYQRNRPSQEERAKRAAEIMARFKPQSVDLNVDTPAATEAA